MAYDPYAPPAETPDQDVGEGADRRAGDANYDAERRPVGIVLLLSVVTLGIYPIIWLFRRRRFLDSLDASAKLGTGLPTVVATLNAGSILFAIFTGALSDGRSGSGVEGIDRLFQITAGIAMLISVFRVANILRSDFARSGRMISVSGVMVFFFGTLYLQYKINQAADTPPLAARKKKKKKKPAPEADAEADAGAPPPDDHSSSSNQPGQ